MHGQLRLPGPDLAAETAGDQDGGAWRLDDETRRRGREGVAAARRALAAARRRPAA